MSALASSRPFRALGVFAAATILAALGGFRVVAVLRDPLGPRPARGFEALRVTGAYQTSAACEPCHKDHVESWKRTFHSTMTRDASASSIGAPFDGRPVDFQGVRSVPRRRGDAFVLDVRGSGAGEIASYEISRVTGSRRMQQFETRITDRYVRLPIAWSIEEKRWLHLSEAFFHPDGEGFDEPRAVWDLNCIFCHTVKARPGLDASDRVDSRSAELGIACEDTAPNGANTDDPAHVTDKVLNSVSLPAGASQVTFRKSFALEATPPNYYDGCVLEIKIGTGAFQDIIAAGGSFVTGGYTGTISTGFSSPIAGRPAWSGSSAAFSTTTVNLPPAAQGQNVILRWRVATDISVSATGFTLDSITATTCAVGCGGGAPVGPPDEVTGDTFASDKQTYSWSAAVTATLYDVLRGDLSALPVGPGNGDEVCFDNMAGTSTVDPSNPAAGSGRFYLVRGQNTCAAPGTYGTTSSLTPRVSTTCP